MESVISVSGLQKSFGAAEAVKDVTFEVRKGEIFGLLGPNGAGKTTTIRIILDLFKPDAGYAHILGGPMSEAKKPRIGYLPEERGLYRDLRLEDCLVYLAELKGVPREVARKRALAYFERFDLIEHRRKKINDLSKGMQQKAQLIATLLHQPDVLIIDEPFSGLDPVNTRLAQELLIEERRRGTTLIMSTHQMHQVEEMCDRIVLIHQGRSVLYGGVDEIRRSHAENAVRLIARGDVPALAGVSDGGLRGNTRTLRLAPGLSPQTVLQQLAGTPGLLIESFELALPTMDDIFVSVVGGNGSAAKAAD